MICTVTFNPSLDYIVSVSDFKLGMTNRTDSELILPGGKGINVSTILKNLGIGSTALGFTAGFTGREISQAVERMGIRSDFIPVENGISRINVKLKNIDGTEINGMGPEISPEKVDELMRKLDVLGEGDVLGVARRMYNVFEDVLDRRAASAVGTLKLLLLENGALGAAMTGSGSAVFGLFPDRDSALRAQKAARDACRESFLAVTE